MKSVIPTLIQEIPPAKKTIESKVDELATLPDKTLSAEDIERITRIGDNKGCMALKGGNPEHQGEAAADRWPARAAERP